MNTDHLKKLAIDATPGPWREVTTLENGFFEVIGDSKRVAHAFGNCRQEAIDNRRYIAAANPAVVLELIAEVERLRDEIDLERLRLSACGVVAMQNTVDSRKDRIGRGHSCYSASYAEVCRAVDAEINLRQQRNELLAALKDAAEKMRRCDYVAARSDMLKSIAKAEG